MKSLSSGEASPVAFRTHNFSLRLTTQEIADYERLAKESGVSVGEWVRGTLNREVKAKKEPERRQK